MNSFHLLIFLLKYTRTNGSVGHSPYTFGTNLKVRLPTLPCASIRPCPENTKTKTSKRHVFCRPENVRSHSSLLTRGTSTHWNPSGVSGPFRGSLRPERSVDHLRTPDTDDPSQGRSPSILVTEQTSFRGDPVPKGGPQTLRGGRVDIRTVVKFSQPFESGPKRKTGRHLGPSLLWKVQGSGPRWSVFSSRLPRGVRCRPSED